MVRLPGSGDCFQISVLTHQEVRLPEEQCEEMMKRAVFITSADWKRQKLSIQKNCQYADCKQLVGAFDNLFLTIDKALQMLEFGPQDYGDPSRYENGTSTSADYN
jgi:hypothetical protein